MWWFLNTTKRLEQLFGVLRSQRNGNLNFDCLDLRDRLATCVGISQVLSRHPEWKAPSRRLTSSYDRKNTHSWKGDTSVLQVHAALCWQRGREEAIAVLRNADIFLNAELDINLIKMNEPGVDILRPYCVQIGVLAGDTPTIHIVDLSNEIDDDEED